MIEHLKRRSKCETYMLLFTSNATKESFIKIGYTEKGFETRLEQFRKSTYYTVDVLDCIQCFSAEDAKSLEKQLHSALYEYRHTAVNPFNGYTECFKDSSYVVNKFTDLKNQSESDFQYLKLNPVDVPDSLTVSIANIKEHLLDIFIDDNKSSYGIIDKEHFLKDFMVYMMYSPLRRFNGTGIDYYYTEIKFNYNGFKFSSYILDSSPDVILIPSNILKLDIDALKDYVHEKQIDNCFCDDIDIQGIETPNDKLKTILLTLADF